MKEITGKMIMILLAMGIGLAIGFGVRPAERFRVGDWSSEDRHYFYRFDIETGEIWTAEFRLMKGPTFEEVMGRPESPKWVKKIISYEMSSDDAIELERKSEP